MPGEARVTGAERRRLALQRKLLEEVAVHVGVADRIGLDQVAPICRHLNHSGCSARLQCGRQRKRNRGAYIDVLVGGVEGGGGEAQVVRVEWQIGELVVSRAVRLRLPAVSADRVLNGDCGVGYDCPGGIRYSAVDRSGVAGRLGLNSLIRKDNKDQYRRHRRALKKRMHALPPYGFSRGLGSQSRRDWRRPEGGVKTAQIVG